MTSKRPASCPCLRVRLATSDLIDELERTRQALGPDHPRQAEITAAIERALDTLRVPSREPTSGAAWACPDCGGQLAQGTAHGSAGEHRGLVCTRCHTFHPAAGKPRLPEPTKRADVKP